MSENHIFLFLIQFFILLGAAKLLGLVFGKLKQPTVTADILVGITLGPTIFGRLFPEISAVIFPKDIIQQNMIETVAWIGILFLLMETGLQVNFGSMWKQKGDAFKIALFGTITPFIFSAVLIFFLPAHYLVQPDKKFIFTLFIASIMAISAMPIAIRALHDLNLLKTDMGFLILSALSINDIIGWLTFTIVLGIFGQNQIDFLNIFLIFSTAILFTAFCLTLGRKFSSYSLGFIKKKFNDQSGLQVTFIILLGLICGAITTKIGIQALLGFFIAGIIAGESRDLSEKDRNVVNKMVYSIFVPIFFINIGLKVDFLKSFDLFLALFITFVGVGVRFIGAWIGVHFTKVPTANRLPISIAHTAGGEMHIVIGMIALQYGLISETLFVSIVCGALVSTIIIGPWLSLAIPRKRWIRPYSLLSEKSTISELSSKNKRFAIAELCLKASEITHLKYDEIFNPVIKREEALSSALEKGIAIPHARLKKLKKPLIIFGKSSRGIEWNSPDGMLSHFMFLILTPADDQDIQLQILASMAQKMTNTKLRENLLKLNNARDIISLWKSSRESV